jgi:predicted RNA binding protein YcfA (HicA-like mRNA interferase family)
MTRLPVLRPREVIRALERFGWRVVRQTGSHIILVKPGHIATLSVPNHPTVARGTLRALLHRAGISVEEFLRALKE